MADLDDVKLRELCERASKEYNHDKLINLVLQINELLEKRRKSNGEEAERKALAGRASRIQSRLAWARTQGSRLDELLPCWPTMRSV